VQCHWPEDGTALELCYPGCRVKAAVTGQAVAFLSVNWQRQSVDMESNHEYATQGHISMKNKPVSVESEGQYKTPS